VTVIREKLEANRNVPISTHFPLNIIRTAEMEIIGPLSENQETVMAVFTKCPSLIDCSTSYQVKFLLTICRDCGDGVHSQLVLEFDRDQLVGRNSIEFLKGDLGGSVPFSFILRNCADLKCD
jgi:hypothetical protein